MESKQGSSAEAIKAVVSYYRKHDRLQELADKTGIKYDYLLVCDITGYVSQHVIDKYEIFVAMQVGKYLGIFDKEGNVIND